MARGIIYLIINKQTGEKYVGNTTLAMNKEWAHQIDRAKRMSREPLHKAFREHGVHNFMIRELDECDELEFNEKTNYWIEQYKPEYNPAISAIEIAKKAIEEYKPAEGISAEGISASAALQELAKPAEGISASAALQELAKPAEGISASAKPKEKRKVNTSHLMQWNENTRGDGKKTGLKIRCKNLETGVCTDYESAREAATQVTGNPNNRANILSAARHYRIAYGHRWQILEEKEKKKAVFGVDKKTEIIGPRCESINAAVRFFEGTDKNGILKSLKNPGRYSWKGYYWFYVR
jgi:group I intron endonuclease